jgi:membrane fusion protein, adhesin transport system
MSNSDPYDSKQTSALVLGKRTENYVAKAILLEEAAPPSYLRNTIRLALLSMIAFLVWAYFSTLDVIALASGQIVPVQSVQVVQHVDGGRIASINVKDGQTVRKGEVLMTVNDVEAKSEYQALNARFWGLYVRAERLRSLISDRPADFSDVPSAYAKVVQEERDALLTARDQVSQLTDQIRILSEVSAIRSDLAREQLATKVQALDAQRALGQAQADLLRYRRAHMDELTDTVMDLTQVEEQKAKLLDRLQRVEVLSPADGVVQGLRFRTVGGVIPPGETIMNVIPTSDQMQAEVKVSPTDIGFLRLGQDARLKVGTFDFMRYGTIDGHVSMISPFSTVDEAQKLTYFKVIITLEQSYVSRDSQKTIEPGMTVQADIITDRQSVLRYLLRPVYVALKQGMRER